MLKYIHDEDKIKKLISEVWENNHSSFYTKKYKDVGLNKEDLLDIENFQKIPFLTRKELEEVHPDNRLFIKPEEISFVAYTSGTTNNNPVITYFSDVDNYYFNPSLGLDVKKLLITYPPLNKNFGHTFIQQCKQGNRKITPIFADYQNLPNSAFLAGKLEIDAIYATPTIASQLVEHIDKYYDRNKIKLLALGSETLTPAKRDFLKKAYPNAKIANLYASSEIGQFILFPCKEIIENGDNLFHLLAPPLLATEIIDGELVLTYANNKAMPLIRYRTGDFFEETKEPCSCSNKGPLLKWSGRKGVDKIRINGLEIKVDDVEKAFQEIISLIGDKYQIHFYSSIKDSVETVDLVVEVENKQLLEKSALLENIKTMVINHLMNNWYLTPTVNLEEIIKRKIFSSIKINILEKLSFTGDKTKRLITHLND